MRRTLATLTVLLCTTAFASACGGEDESPSTTEPTSTEANSTEATPTDPASSDASEPTETSDGTQQIEVTIAINIRQCRTGRTLTAPFNSALGGHIRKAPFSKVAKERI